MWLNRKNIMSKNYAPQSKILMDCVIVGNCNEMLRKNVFFQLNKRDKKQETISLSEEKRLRRGKRWARTLGILHVDVVHFCCIMLLRVRIPIQGSTRLEIWFKELSWNHFVRGKSRLATLARLKFRFIYLLEAPSAQIASKSRLRRLVFLQKAPAARKKCLQGCLRQPKICLRTAPKSASLPVDQSTEKQKL